MFRKRRRKQQNSHYETIESTISEVLEKAKKSSDFLTISPLGINHPLKISYYNTLIDTAKLEQSVLPYIQVLGEQINDLSEIRKIIPIEDISITNDHDALVKGLHTGAIALYFENDLNQIVLLNINNSRLGQRETNDALNEFSVIGPKVGFVEDLTTNLHLIRDHLKTSDLIFVEQVISTRSKRKVVYAYIEGITNPEYVNTLKQRLDDLDVDIFIDNTLLEQLISDNTSTPFPLFITTERVDRVTSALINGKVVLMSDKSSYAVIGPAKLMDFYANPEDDYLPYLIASFFKLIRIFGMLFSIFASSFYIAILTYHYEVVPRDLLGPIIFSRANVPFSPVLEVLFLEITIDLLREAGARLPFKIGQTLGIVGGIVIGQATVEAALTSNILLIIIALSALASFTTPNYKMSNAVRLLRYPFIILASIWGGLGIYVGLAFLIAHLSRLKSLGMPYLLPLYPYRKGEVSHSFISPNFIKYSKRSSFVRPLSLRRFSPKENQDPDDGLNTEN